MTTYSNFLAFIRFSVCEAIFLEKINNFDTLSNAIPFHVKLDEMTGLVTRYLPPTESIKIKMIFDYND